MKSLNRIFSQPLTALFLKTPIRPNQITFLSALAGLFAFLWFCVGTKTAFILGALFFEAFYVLDNCDGEVARAKKQTSEFGSWLDTSVDYLVHILAFAGITIGVYRAGSGPLILAVGMVAAIGVFFSFFVVVMQKRKKYGLAIHGMPKVPEGSVKKVGLLDKLVDLLSAGDFSIALLLFALFGKMELLLWLAAFGANLFCLILLLLNLKYLRARI